MIKILKKPVVGYALVRDIHGYYNRPITMDYEGSSDLEFGDSESNHWDIIDEDAAVLGYIPAQTNTFKVLGCEIDDTTPTYKFLGYEYPGVDNPNWKREFNNRR